MSSCGSIAKSVFLFFVMLSGLAAVYLSLTAFSRSTSITRVAVPDVIQKVFNKNVLTMDQKTNSKANLISLAKYIRKARLHARGVKTDDALKAAEESVSKMLDTVGLSYSMVTERKVVDSKHICPEDITNTLLGSPLYDIGYVVQKCFYDTPLENIVTILMLYEQNTHSELEIILKGIRGYVNEIAVIVGLQASVNQNEISEKFNNVKMVSFDRGKSKGEMWNTIAKHVKTEYALIARDVTSFNYDARIDRMVREIERLGVTVVGGSIRDTENKWRIGCHQRAFRNFTVSYLEGYDESIHDCVFCDHIEGPFLIRKDDLFRIEFDKTMPEMGLFEDFFMRLHGESVICPDSMYYTNIKERSSSVNDWLSFGKKRSLYELKFSTGLTINFGCKPGSYLCNMKSGKMLTPCCMFELAKLNNDIMDVCKDGNIVCQIHCGTLVGAVKFYNVLPWERDGDIQFHASNFSAVMNIRSKFNLKGYQIIPGPSPTPCPDTSRNGYFDIKSKYWRTELYSYCDMDSKILPEKGLNLTLISVAGKWVIGPRNPGLSNRNKYPYSFRHSEHYIDIHQGSNDIYRKHQWIKCPNPGAHDCLDNYRNDGNIQFMNVIP